MMYGNSYASQPDAAQYTQPLNQPGYGYPYEGKPGEYKASFDQTDPASAPYTQTAYAPQSPEESATAYAPQYENASTRSDAGYTQERRLGVPRPEDWWEVQTAKAFIKLEPLFDGEKKKSSKLIFSFVKHGGAANGYKRTDNIKIYLPLSGGVSNGETGPKQVIGQNGESLVSMIRSGDFYRMCVASKRNAAASNAQYPEPLFQTIGGSGEKRGKDGSFTPVKFRKFTIAPNMQQDGYLFTAMECDGFKTKTGGYAPMQGMPNRRMILVPVSEHAIRSLAENISVHWNAYVTAMEIKDILGL